MVLGTWGGGTDTGTATTEKRCINCGRDGMARPPRVGEKAHKDYTKTLPVFGGYYDGYERKPPAETDCPDCLKPNSNHGGRCATATWWEVGNVI